jgi:putative transposase
MKKARYSEQPMLDILGPIEAGQEIADLARVHGISKSTIHRWQARYGGLSRDDATHLKQVEDENRRPGTLVADLSLDNAMLNEVVGKKWWLYRVGGAVG